MDVDDKEADYSEVMNDPDFLQSVLQVGMVSLSRFDFFWYILECCGSMFFVDADILRCRSGFTVVRKLFC